MLIYVDISVGQWILCVSVHSYADEWHLLSMHDYEPIFLCDGIGVRMGGKKINKKWILFHIPWCCLQSSSGTLATWIKLSYCLAVILLAATISRQIPNECKFIHGLGIRTLSCRNPIRPTVSNDAIYRLILATYPRTKLIEIMFKKFLGSTWQRHTASELQSTLGKKHTASALQSIIWGNAV
jgi:hypothetical protein